ncbi:major cell surface glycoprotein, partial [Halorubrum sp. C3]
MYNGSTIYQGEDDLTFYDENGSDISAGALQKTAGNNEGTSLTQPIPEDAATGTYATSGGFSMIVQEPRITTSEVQINGTTSDVSQVGPSSADNLTINGEWNFGEAENLSITVEDESGTDITGEVVDDPTLSSADGVDETAFDLGGEDSGEYTVIFEGADNLDQDSVVEEYTIELTTDDTVGVETAEDTVTQGTNLEYTVTGGTNGQYHIVTVDSEDFRSNNIDSVFRNVGDTVEVGFADTDSNTRYESAADRDVAYAVVEIDGTTGTGSIRSQSLDDTTVTLDVYNASGDTLTEIDSLESVDDMDFDVEEGSLTLDSPDSQYTIGSEVDVNGTATSSDAVDIYARDNNQWELVVENINVDSSDEFEEEDVTLSSTGNQGDSIFQQTGTYRIGAIDRSESNGSDTIQTSDFSSATSVQNSITVVEGELSAQLETINGQVNTLDNSVDISGNAEGQGQIALVYVDSRGDVAAQTVDVDSDGTIDIDDRSIPEAADGDGNLDNGEFSEGTVTAHFISVSRDDSVGDGQVPGQGSNDDISALVTWVNDEVAERSLNAEQARSLIVSETTEDTASDDLMITQSFRYTESQTTVDSVFPEEAQADGINPVASGETLVATGETNLRPDDNSITVEILNEDGDSLEISSTDEWETTGQWNTTFDTSNLEPGTYTVESDDGENTDRAEIEIVEERQQPDDGSDGS